MRKIISYIYKFESKYIKIEYEIQTIFKTSSNFAEK